MKLVEPNNFASKVFNCRTCASAARRTRKVGLFESEERGKTNIARFLRHKKEQHPPQKREQSKAVEENFAKRRENNSRLSAKSFTHTLKMKERKNDSRLWLAIIRDWCPLSVNACFGPGIGLCDNRYRDKLSVIVVRMLEERFSPAGSFR